MYNATIAELEELVSVVADFRILNVRLTTTLTDLNNLLSACIVCDWFVLEILWMIVQIAKRSGSCQLDIFSYRNCSHIS